MDADSAQKDRRAVQQNVCTSGFNRTKPDLLCDPVCLAGNLNLVKLGSFRRPKRQVCIKDNARASPRVGLKNLGYPGFRNLDRDALAQFRPVKLYPAFDAVGRSFLELNDVVLNECLWHLDQGDRASNATVVPPIRSDGRHLVLGPTIIDPDYDEIVSWPHAFGDFEVKRSETALVTTERLAIQVHVSLIVCRSKAKKQSVLVWFLIVEGLLVPDSPFVKQKRLALRVPITGHVKLAGMIKIVFDQFRLRFRFVIL